MPEAHTQDHHVPQIADHIFEVPSDSARKFLVHGLRRNLISVKIRGADYYNDQMRGLALQYLRLMRHDDQSQIRFQIQEMEELEEKLDKTNSRFRRFFLAMEYRRLSKETYFLVKEASNQVINNHIKNQVREATDAQVPSTALPIAVKSHTVNTMKTLVNMHESPLVDAITSDVDRAEMTTYQSKTTGDPAVLLSLHSNDEPTRHFVATLSESPQEAETDTTSLWTSSENGFFGTRSEIEESI